LIGGAVRPQIRFGMRVWPLVPLLSLGALIALALTAWLGEDELTFDVDVELAGTPLSDPPAPESMQLSGVVVDAEGAPVSEALVALLEDGRLRWTHSGSDGRFTLDALGAGEREIYLVARGHPPTVLRASAPGTNAKLVLPARIEDAPQIEPGERSILNGRVRRSGATTTFAGYRLALIPLAPPTELGNAVPRWQPVGPDGTFHVRELAHAQYRAILLPPWAGESFWPDLLAPLDESSVKTFSHPLPEGTELELAVQAGAITGRIFRLGHAAGQLATSEPLSGAVVFGTPEGTGGHVRTFGPATTLADGSFRLDDLPAGDYRVRVVVGDLTRERIVTVVPQSTTDADFDALE
jgi:hypothetical protein